MFIVLLEYLKPLEHIEAHLAEHREFLDRHFSSGLFLTSGPKVPRTGGVILVKAESRPELESILGQDPFHRESLAQYQVIEFTPTKFAEGTQALLG